MKILKRLSLIFISMIFITSISSAQILLHRLGVHPFSEPSLTSITDLKEMIRKNEDDIKIGFEIANIPEVFDDFMAQYQDTDITKVFLKNGSEFEWMFHRKKGQGPVLIAYNLTWIGKDPIEAYQILIDTNGNRYTFIIPLICNNISLRGVTKLPPIGHIETVESVVFEPTEVAVTVDTTKIIEKDTISSTTNTKMIKSYSCSEPSWKLDLLAGFPLAFAPDDETINYGIILETPLGFSVGPFFLGLGAGAFTYDFSDIYGGAGITANLCINEILELNTQLIFKIDIIGFYNVMDNSGPGYGLFGSSFIPINKSPISIGAYGGIVKYDAKSKEYDLANIGIMLSYSF